MKRCISDYKQIKSALNIPKGKFLSLMRLSVSAVGRAHETFFTSSYNKLVGNKKSRLYLVFSAMHEINRHLQPTPRGPHHRTVDYMRISITDRCNERCLYCLPEGYKNWQLRKDLLSDEEILAVVSSAAALGFRKFRVTGGEPLIRPGVEKLIQAMSEIPDVQEIGLSSNATRLESLADPLARAGLRGVNVSLDAVDPKIYHHITKGDLCSVLSGLKAAQKAGLEIKLNSVLIRGMNETQIIPLIDFAAENNFLLRFIELMPVSVTEVLTEANFFPVHEAMKVIGEKWELIPDLTPRGNGPASYYKIKGRDQAIGFIGAMTNLHFCENCNKVRLTADGKIRPCLGNHNEFDLMPALRPHVQPGEIQQMILQSLREKPPEHLFRDQYQPGRIMTAIGG